MSVKRSLSIRQSWFFSSDLADLLIYLFIFHHLVPKYLRKTDPVLWASALQVSVAIFTRVQETGNPTGEFPTGLLGHCGGNCSVTADSGVNLSSQFSVCSISPWNLSTEIWHIFREYNMCAWSLSTEIWHGSVSATYLVEAWAQRPDTVQREQHVCLKPQNRVLTQFSEYNMSAWSLSTENWHSWLGTAFLLEASALGPETVLCTQHVSLMPQHKDLKQFYVRNMSSWCLSTGTWDSSVHTTCLLESSAQGLEIVLCTQHDSLNPQHRDLKQFYVHNMSPWCLSTGTWDSSMHTTCLLESSAQGLETVYTFPWSPSTGTWNSSMYTTWLLEAPAQGPETVLCTQHDSLKPQHRDLKQFYIHNMTSWSLSTGTWNSSMYTTWLIEASAQGLETVLCTQHDFLKPQHRDLKQFYIHNMTPWSLSTKTWNSFM